MASLVTVQDARKCPFVRAVTDGRYDEAKAIARRGPEPADEGVIPLLVLWAVRAGMGLPIPFPGHEE